MDLSEIEKEINPELKWEQIGQIPNFPAQSFHELKRSIESETLKIATDFQISNRLATWLYGKTYAIFFILLSWLPYIVSIISLVLAFILKNFWLSLGLPLGISSIFFANPYNPLKNLLTILAWLSVIVFGWGLWYENDTFIYLPMFFSIPFFITRFTYNLNQQKLITTAMKSEKLLIYLYQTHNLYLMDTASQKIYSHQG